MTDEFYDLVYEAWRSGKNPDLVSYDELDRLLSVGYYSDEISINDIYPNEDITEKWDQDDPWIHDQEMQDR